MIYGYIRVSTDKQTLENQRHIILNYCEAHGLHIDGWIEETISGTKALDKRKLGQLLRHVQPGDAILCSEISRLGRSLFMVMSILSLCMSKCVSVHTIKDGFDLSDDLQSKVLTFAFAIAAEIERQMISQRTREALDLRRSQGVTLGRPKGALGKHTKLSGYESTIRVLIEQDNSYAELARLFHVARSTMKRFCDARNIKRPFSRNAVGFISDVAG